MEIKVQTQIGKLAIEVKGSNAKKILRAIATLESSQKKH